MIAEKGMRLFAVIDQSAEAAQAGLQLRETTLVIFGSPAAGTPVMAAAGTRTWTVTADPEGEFCAFLRPEVPAEQLHGLVADSAGRQAQARW